MTGLAVNAGYSTGSFFSQIVGWVAPATTSIYGLLINPYFLGIVLILVAISLIPGSDN